MLRPSAPDLKVYLHRVRIDMQAGRNGLAAIAREVMQQDYGVGHQRHQRMVQTDREPGEVRVAAPVSG